MTHLSDRAYMTPLLNRIADVAGERAALILGREKAGERISIPNTMSADHWLAQLVGLEAATAIAQHFGSQKIELPVALGGEKRRRAATIAELLDSGYSINAIVRKTGVSRSTVKEHLRKKPRDDGQGTLF